jgi:hypothetical protein
MMNQRLSAFATLTDTPERRSTLRAALKQTLEGDKPLIAHAYFRVETVPGFRTLTAAFKQLKDSSRRGGGSSRPP